MENSFSSSLSLTQPLTLLRFNKGIRLLRCALFPSISCYSYHRGCIWCLWCQSLSHLFPNHQSDYPVLHCVHFCMVALQEYRERLHGDRAAEHKLIKAAMQLCVQIAQPQAPGRGTNYIFSLSPRLLRLPWCPQSVSMCGQAEESKWLDLFLSLSPSLSPFLNLNLLPGIFVAPLVLRHSTTRLLTWVQKNIISVLPAVPLCLTFSTSSFYTCSLEVRLWLFYLPLFTLSITLSSDSLGTCHTACRTWTNM